MDAAQTRAHATGEDPGRSVARLVALIGSVASLGAVAVVLIQTQNTSELESYLLAAIAVVSVAASWALIQVDYMLRIAAHLLRAIRSAASTSTRTKTRCTPTSRTSRSASA